MSESSKPPMTLARWYGTSMRIPDYESHRFIDFAVASFGIVRTIVRDEIGKEISVSFMQGGTAHADWDNKLISINEDYLKGEVGGGRPKLNADDALSNILGIEVHEAAHFAFSPETTVPWQEHIKANTKCAFHPMVASTIGNIVEDIYIEAEVEREVPGMVWMLDCMNRIFFSAYDEQRTLDDAAEIVAAPNSLLEVAKACNILILAKTRKEIETNPFLGNLFQMARSSTELPFLSQRTELALQLYEELMANITQEECDANGGQEGDGEGGKKGDKEGDEKGDKETKEALADTKERSEGFTPSHEKRSGKVAKATGIEARIISRGLERLEDADVKMIFADEKSGETNLFIEKTMKSGANVVADKRYAQLAEVARQRAAVNRPYGLDRTQGHSIRKLSRILTDNKIFAEPVRMSSYKPMEVVILVDASGSMRQEGSSSSKSRIDKACRAALGAATSLVEARCEVAVYAHTGDIHTRNEVVIYGLKNFNEPIHVLSNRMGWMMSKEPLSENRDGYAISYIAKKFSRSPRRKLMIVISDGEPAATNYHGESANLHTKQEVQKVRRMGIDVLSISITASASKANNEIYGKKKNVYNQDPNIIQEIVRSLIVGN